jgi:pilus assembly protein Flp/PilA
MRSCFLVRFLREETGQDLVEYALVATLIALGAVALIKGFGGKISNALNTVTTNLSSNI